MRNADMGVRQWSERGEYAQEIGDFGADPDFNNAEGADVMGDGVALQAMEQTPIGEPPSDYDVRSIYDSRPVNGYDFNYSGFVNFQPPQAPSFIAVTWIIDFDVPNGYRVVPRKWHVEIENAIIADPPQQNLVVAIRQGKAILPNNGSKSDQTNSMPQGIVCGYGVDVDTFFVCEENTSFGIQGTITGTSAVEGAGSISAFVTVYGNLIPVSEVALPYSIANRKLQ